MRGVKKVDVSERLALHEQVASEIRRAIADGRRGLASDTLRRTDLATVLGVNANTVFRVPRILRDEGLLEFRRGRGITVSGTPVPVAEPRLVGGRVDNADGRLNP